MWYDFRCESSKFQRYLSVESLIGTEWHTSTLFMLAAGVVCGCACAEWSCHGDRQHMGTKGRCTVFLQCECADEWPSDQNVRILARRPHIRMAWGHYAAARVASTCQSGRTADGRSRTRKCVLHQESYFDVSMPHASLNGHGLRKFAHMRCKRMLVGRSLPLPSQFVLVSQKDLEVLPPQIDW